MGSRGRVEYLGAQTAVAELREILYCTPRGAVLRKPPIGKKYFK